jgi:iron complex transport system permease protein
VPARDRVPARPGKGASASGRSAATRPAPARRGRPGTPGPRPADAQAAEQLVVGTVPLLARLAGVLLGLAGLVAAVGVFPTYLVVGGTSIGPVTGPVAALVALVAPLAAVVVGVGLALGRVPRLGLAYAAVSGALAVGRLLIEVFQGDGSTSRPAVDVLAGERVVTSSVQVGAGWVLGLVALVLTVLAGVTAMVAWGRTVMEDGGSLDPLRPALAGASVLLGAGAVLCLALPSADVPDRVEVDPLTGLETVVTAPGPPGLLERPGLALLGGLLLAGALLLCAVIAPSLRPRLGAVGGLLGVAVSVLAAGLSGLRDALHSPDLDWTVTGAGLLVIGLGLVGVTALAWRARTGAVPVETPDERFATTPEE